MKKFFLLVLYLGQVYLLNGCGGGGTQPLPPPPPMVSSVAVAPTSASILVKATQQFTATVQGAGNFNPAVNWYVNDVQGGNSTVGTITASGLFTAPNTVPNPTQVTVKAQSVQDTSKSGTSSATINPENIQISVSPTSASLQLSSTQRFNVTVTGTVNQSFSWTINGAPINAATPWGTIDSTGLYTAPSLLPASPMVTLTATSLEDPTISASAVATILATTRGIRVTITPQNPQVVFDGSQSIQFMATVTGTNNTAVNWGVDNSSGETAGNITSTGIFTPLSFNCSNVVPFAVIHVVSVADPGAQAATNVNLIPPTPTITGISPQPASAETTIMISGTFAQGATTTLFFSGPNGTTIPSPANLVTTTAAGGIVPLGAASGSLSIQQVCASPISGFQYPAMQSKPVNFQRLPHLRIRADRKDIAAGESVQLRPAFLGDSTLQPISWGNGISSSGVYVAPTQVGADTFVKLSACIQNTIACDSLIVRVNPMRIDPESPTVPTGGTLQLSVLSGGTTVVPNWNILAGGGSLLSSGIYTAPTTLQDSGPVLIEASYGGLATRASLGVTNAYPGLVNRVSDYLDNSSPTPPSGTITSSLTVDGSRAYVLSVDSLPIWAVPKYCWIDVYDITDPVHPAWIDATEALNSEPSTFACSDKLFAYGGFLFELIPSSGSSLGPFNKIAEFTFKNNHLSLQALWTVPAFTAYSFNQGAFYVLPDIINPGASGGPISVSLLNVRTGNLTQTDLSLPPPQPGVPAGFLAPTGEGNLIYVLINQWGSTTGGPPKMAAYDLSSSPPLLLGTVDALVGAPPGIAGTPKILGNDLYDAWDVFDISGGLPLRLGTLPFGIQDINLNRSLALSGTGPISVIDVSNPSAAKFTGILDDGSSGGDAVWVGDFAYLRAGTQGWGIFDAAPPGGQLPLDPLVGGGQIGTIFDQTVSGTHLYTAQQSDGPAVAVYDLSISPPALVGSYSESGQDPLSLLLLGNYLFVGTREALLVLDVSSPSSPIKVATIALPTSSMAISGNSLFVGTTDNHLTVLDVSNPKSPIQVAQVSLPDFPNILRTSGTLLFIADNTAGLLTYAISNPHSPILLSQYKPSSATEDVAIDGNLTLLAATDGGLVIADINNPTAPVLVSQIRLDTLSCFIDCLNPAALSVAIHDGLVYVGSVGTVYGEVFGFDYRTLAHPRLVSLMSYGGALDEAVLNFAFYQSRMFVGGSLFSADDRESDITQPRNVINLYYPAFPAGSGSFSASMVGKSGGFTPAKMKAH